jgi:hypothetical protein
MRGERSPTIFGERRAIVPAGHHRRAVGSGDDNRIVLAERIQPLCYNNRNNKFSFRDTLQKLVTEAMPYEQLTA